MAVIGCCSYAILRRRPVLGGLAAPPCVRVRYNARMPLSVVILAAGQGKRMNSDLPKVLQPLAGRPLLGHVVSRARSLAPSSMHVVYGHGGDAVREALVKEKLQWALQGEQLGTGHAVMQAMPNVAD